MESAAVDTLNWVVPLIPALPLVAFLITILFGKWFIKEAAHWLPILAMAASFVLSLVVWWNVRGTEEPFVRTLWDWIPVGKLQVPIALQVDQLTAVMLLVVTGVGTLIFIYSKGYMHGDPGYYRFFAYLSLFAFSMLMLVLGANYLLLYFGWEAVGLCSYYLIGFYYHKPSAASAGKKAFLTNRVGDFGFGLGVMLIFTTFGTLDYIGVFEKVVAGEGSHAVLVAIALLLFMGAMGKSAQFPLHVWLPDAMEGPTPVSALIHAATMVTAGVYMVARSSVIFASAHEAMLVVGGIGAFTAIFAATIGIAQNDIKRVMAYSTVSQLGYMFMALGVGAWAAAIFHLVTHAFFKALLVPRVGLGHPRPLGRAGHAQDGGPAQQDPLHVLGADGGRARPGRHLPLRRLLVEGRDPGRQLQGRRVRHLDRRRDRGLHHRLLHLPADLHDLHGQVAHGPRGRAPRAREPLGHDRARSWCWPSSRWSRASSWVSRPRTASSHKFLEPVFASANHIMGVEAEGFATIDVVLMVTSLCVALAGIALAYLFYFRRPDELPQRAGAAVPRLYRGILNKWYIDEIYNAAVINPVINGSRWLWRVVDAGIIDGTVNGVGKLWDLAGRVVRPAADGAGCRTTPPSCSWACSSSSAP